MKSQRAIKVKIQLFYFDKETETTVLDEIIQKEVNEVDFYDFVRSWKDMFTKIEVVGYLERDDKGNIFLESKC